MYHFNVTNFVICLIISIWFGFSMYLMTKLLITTYNTFMQAIPRGELHPCIEGKRQENLSKNKYTTIFPCR